MVNETQTVETLSSDVSAFCALLARILQRCLAEQDARILTFLSFPLADAPDEVSYESAA